MYIFQQSDQDVSLYTVTDRGNPVQADTVSELVTGIVFAEYNPKELSNHLRVIKRTEIEPVIRYKDEVV